MSKAYFKKKRLDSDRQRPAIDPRLMGARCDICPLKGAKPVHGEGPMSPALAIVGEAPGRQEEEAGLPFIGKSGQYVENLLQVHGLTRQEVLLDNAIACFPPGGDLKVFIQVAKKELKTQREAVLKDPLADDEEKKEAKTLKLENPVDCCRPRLMMSLGIPRCKRCGGWKLLPTHPFNCSCGRSAQWIHVKGRTPPKAVVVAGNSALLSLTGHDGIMAKQLYTFEVK